MEIVPFFSSNGWNVKISFPSVSVISWTWNEDVFIGSPLYQRKLLCYLYALVIFDFKWTIIIIENILQPHTHDCLEHLWVAQIFHVNVVWTKDGKSTRYLIENHNYRDWNWFQWKFTCGSTLFWLQLFLAALHTFHIEFIWSSCTKWFMSTLLQQEDEKSRRNKRLEK